MPLDKIASKIALSLAQRHAQVIARKLRQKIMTEENGTRTTAIWLRVIGRTLAYLCMKEAERSKKFDGVLERVAFLESLGLPLTDAATAAGSSKASVDELRRLQKIRKKDGKNARTKKTRVARR